MTPKLLLCILAANACTAHTSEPEHIDSGLVEPIDANAVTGDGNDSLPDAAPHPCEQYAELFGLNVSFADPIYIDDSVSLGARWLRVEVRYPLLPLSHYRSVIESAHAQGLKILLLVGYGSTANKPAWTANDLAWDAYRVNFREDLQDIAAALGDVVDAWEVWNEPDHQLTGGGYDPGVPANQFGLLLTDASSILRANSQALLVIGGLATKRYSYMATAIAAAGGSLDYDGVGVHTYYPSTWTTAIAISEINEVITGWHQATGLPVWITEAGAVATTDAEAHAAAYIDTLYQEVWANHRDTVKSILYFSWHDAVGAANERFGLIRLDGSHKPGFDHYQALSATCPD